MKRKLINSAPNRQLRKVLPENGSPQNKHES